MELTIHLYQVSLAFTATTSFALALLVCFKSKKGTNNTMWALTCLFTGIWASCVFWYTTFPLSHEKAMLGGQLTNISAAFIPVFFTHFCLSFVGKKPFKNKLLLLGYTSCFVILAFGFTPLFVPKVVRFRSFYNYVSPGPIFHLHTFAFGFYMLYSEYVLYKSMKNCSPAKRNQIKYILLSTSAAFICGSFAFIGAYQINVEPVPIHFVSVYTITITYAIIKHNLLSINIVLRKGLIYSLLITVISLIYIAMALFIESIFRGIVGYTSITITISATTIIVLLFQPLKNYLQKILDKYFFRGSIDQINEENIKLRNELQKSEKIKAVSTLAAGMAHEIKNPLTSIKTFTEYLPQKGNNPEFREKFRRLVGNEVERINTIVTQLLEFSKPSELKLQETALITLIDNTLDLLNNDLLKSNISIEKNYPSSVPTISADTAQLKQVFLNLVLNAKDAMPDGGALSIIINTTSENITIKIADTGKGISKEDLKHIFDPFFSKKDGGTGLGLSVVHGIIKKHGGKISAVSEINKGTSFTLTFPKN